MEQYRTLLEVTEAIASHRDLASLFGDLAQHLRTVVEFDGIVTLLYDSTSGLMRIHRLETSLPMRLPAEWPVQEAGGWVWEHQQPLLIQDTERETRFPQMMESAHQNSVKSYAILPLTSAGRCLGALAFGSQKEATYNEEDLAFLQQVANQVAMAVDNALKFDGLRLAEQQVARERDHWRLLLEVNNAVVSHLDMRELVKFISASLRGVMPHDAAGIALYDAEQNQLREYVNVASRHYEAFEEGDLIPLEGTPAGLVFTSGRPFLVRRPDLERFPADRLAQRLAEDSPKSACLVPLTSHGRKLGVLGVGSVREEAFTEDDLELLAQIASQIAIAVDNALNFERARIAEQQYLRERDHLQLLLEINNAVTSSLDLHELFRTVSRVLRRTFHNDLAGMGIYDAEKRELRVYALDRPESVNFVAEGMLMPLEGTPAGLAITTRQTIMGGQPAPEQFYAEPMKRAFEQGFKSGCVVPLISRDRVIGVLTMASQREAAFRKEDGERLTQMAGQIAIAMENALAYRQIEALKNKLSEEKLYLEEEINTAYDFEQIIGSSPALRRILKQVETVAPTDSTVLIQGETGTGKELIARAIHSLSARRERTLVKLNCAAIPTGLLESELFGHEKGAFTGAIAPRIGRFELAHKGSLFLDEVGEIPLELQPKLLRVLQEQEFERLGSTRTLQVDVRLIAATNRDLAQMVAERQYRNDLYYRLNVFPIRLPPLRERREDIPLLLRFFANKFARRMKKRIEAIPAEAVAALQEYHWPGNIRELENFIERAVILTQGPELQVPLTEIELPTRMVAARATASESSDESTSLESVEREHILRVLRETNWTVGGPDGAAARLGLKRTTLQARMKKLGITRQS
jgi:formate hydrogenlyase transcriptional activator